MVVDLTEFVLVTYTCGKIHELGTHSPINPVFMLFVLRLSRGRCGRCMYGSRYITRRKVCFDSCGTTVGALAHKTINTIVCHFPNILVRSFYLIF